LSSAVAAFVVVIAAGSHAQGEGAEQAGENCQPTYSQNIPSYGSGSNLAGILIALRGRCLGTAPA
jgi:hypothetical protein